MTDKTHVKETGLLFEHERADDLQIKGYRVIQDPDAYCFGTDAVLLANFAVAKKSEKVMDLCTGSGVVPILMCAKTNAQHFTGIEIQPGAADRARRSVLLNGLEERIAIKCMDIKKAADEYGSAAFDVVTANPPYLNAGKPNERDEIAIARHEMLLTLQDVARVSAVLLRFGGRLYMVHRSYRLADIICALRENGLEIKRLKFMDCGLVLAEAIRGGRAWVRVEWER